MQNTFDFSAVGYQPIPERQKVDSQDVLNATVYLAGMPPQNEGIFPTRLLRVLQKAKENVINQDATRKYSLSYIKTEQDRKVRVRRLA